MRHYLLDPFGEQAYMNNIIFESPYGVFKELLKGQGIELDTYDKGDLATADKILFFNYNDRLYKRCQQLGIPKEKLVLFLFEPNVVIPGQYNEEIWQQFAMVFTFRDDLLTPDRKNFYKLRPIQGSFSPSLTSFAKRNFLTLINANRYSYVDNELYTLRREAIHFFDAKPGFDLFGHRWADRRVVISPRNVMNALRAGKIGTLLRNIVTAQQPITSYRGSVKDKYETLLSYKFAICFENEKEAPGYISEKIFDCLYTGTLPIYFGAPNITDYIPKDCFIDLRDFADFSELYTYLMTMDEAEFLKKQQAGQDFLASKKFAMWRPREVFKEIVPRLI